jgi:hypothetical protein
MSWVSNSGDSTPPTCSSSMLVLPGWSASVFTAVTRLRSRRKDRPSPQYARTLIVTRTARRQGANVAPAAR